jgi:uncharacterized protein YqeY
LAPRNRRGDDTFGRALALAAREKSEAAAIERYVATLNADPAALASVRAVYAEAIEETLREMGVADAARRDALSGQLWGRFGDNLRRGVAAHLRETQAVSSAMPTA